MKTSARPRDHGGSYSSRRGHGVQLSISDTNHHVTEAIGDMYGDDNYKRDSRPLSFVPEAEPADDGAYFDHANAAANRANMRPGVGVNGGAGAGAKAHSLPTNMAGQRSASFEGDPLSPTLSLHSLADTANTQFPLNDVEYESNPAAVQQELSNLQALRRMSMDVGNAGDPDLPSFQGVSLMPSVAPTGDDDEDDPSRLFWVPARVHPELAPMEFKTFLENRVQSIKRRSGDQSSLSPGNVERSGSSGASLRRKKSMLSRQIDNSGGRGAIGYRDGAEQIERKKSLSLDVTPELKIADLQELDALVRDPTKALQKLSLDSNRNDSGVEVPESEDMPILPTMPGHALRRSTRTTYRKGGSIRKGERVPYGKRGAAKAADTDGEESPVVSPIGSSSGFPLTKVQSAPGDAPEKHSKSGRPSREIPSAQDTTSTPSDASAALEGPSVPRDTIPLQISTNQSSVQAQSAAASRATPTSTTPQSPIPKIVETPPPVEDNSRDAKSQKDIPERLSSQTPASPNTPSQPIVPDEPPLRSSKRPGMGPRAQSSAHAIPKIIKSQTLNDMTQKPSPLLASNGRTDSLTFIPTAAEPKASDKKGKDKKDRDEGESASRKTSWGTWFKGGEEKEKKEKRRDDAHEKESSKKLKAKGAHDKAYDNTRLDVLQSSIDGTPTRGRESLVLDRDNVDSKLSDERKKEATSRKIGADSKKDKDGFSLSSLFGGSKKKADRDSGGKKASSLRTLSPDPPHRQLKPDVDYHWTRFSLLEERAIYRMAHIKLANPRRALYSQVLLSNFMYSYLAKVQQMHPNGQVSAQQKRQQEAERQRKEAEQRYIEQQQQQQQDGQYQYDYHQVSKDIL